MATTIIEEQNCRACGVDIREGALFCYNCGGSVTYDEAPAENNDAASDAWFREELAEEAAEEKSAEEEAAEEQNVDEHETKNVVRPKGLRESKRLRSAAALRRKAKTVQRKKFETVVWEEHENPSGLFILVAVVVALLTAAIFWLAIYLK